MTVNDNTVTSSTALVTTQLMIQQPLITKSSSTIQSRCAGPHPYSRWLMHMEKTRIPDNSMGLKNVPPAIKRTNEDDDQELDEEVR